jgi:CxxC-x17-CxxC domain-containing protein
VSFLDKTLTCRDCGNEFVFTSGEQDFYQTRGLQNEPRRCPECRNTRRSEPRQSREMHDVVCSGCGQIAQVPFIPSGTRPVYCNDCFKKDRGGVAARY